MEVTAPYIRLLTGVLVLLVAQVDHHFFAHKADPGFPHIVPDRLQFFDYESFTVNCEVDAFTEWRVMRKLNKTISTDSSICNTSAPSCFIEPAFGRDSGEYWCENKEGQRSNTVNITVTAGFVILEIPAHPVMEGDDVLLPCTNKKTQSQHIDHIVDFHKDGSKLETLYSKNMTIHNVSKSDEGLYKCSISGTGESAESRLTVVKQSDSDFLPEETHPPHSSDFLTLLWISVIALLAALLLLLAGLRLCRKHKVLGKDSATEPHQATYAVVNQQRKNKESQGENAVDTDVTYAAVEKQWKKKEPQASGAGTKSSLSEDNVIYSLINF